MRCILPYGGDRRDKIPPHGYFQMPLRAERDRARLRGRRIAFSGWPAGPPFSQMRRAFGPAAKQYVIAQK
jgi:hypothetical protein